VDKLKALLQSRKFWALIAGLVSVAAGYFSSAIAPDLAIKSAVALIVGYIFGTGIEDSGR